MAADEAEMGVPSVYSDVEFAGRGRGQAGRGSGSNGLRKAHCRHALRRSASDRCVRWSWYAAMCLTVRCKVVRSTQWL